MDSGVHEEGSSSPSDNLTIYGTRVFCGPPAKRRNGGTAREDVEVILSDGSSFFVPAELWRRQGLADGATVPEGWLEKIQHAADTSRARERAMTLIAMREHSCAEISRKLRQKGFSEAAAAAAVESLSADGLVNDARFAEEWIRSRLRRRPVGRAALLAGLARAGVDRAESDAAVARVAGEDPELLAEAIDRAARRIERGGRVDPETLRRKLASRGFSYREIRKFVEDRDSVEDDRS